QGVGDLFVVRVAGNVVGEIELDSIEYAITQLHTALIVVLGHGNCGAVSAVLAGKAADFPALEKMITPALQGVPRDEKGALEKAIKANVQLGVQFLSQNPKLKPLLDQKEIRVVGGIYNLETGRVELLQ